MSDRYSDTMPDVEEVKAMKGVVAVEFGADWCGYCNASRTFIDAAIAKRTDTTHLKFEDGPGRKLGRAFRVTLWPTVVFLKNGVEQSRVVRPTSEDAVTKCFDSIPL